MNVIFTCGGTAGHVNPALALAGYMREKDPGVNILFVGTPGGMERGLVEQQGYAFRGVEVSGFRRSFKPDALRSNLHAVRNLMTSPRRAREILREFRPDLVVGTGGYASYPMVRCAAKAGVPTAVHESNMVPGLTTKQLEGYADRIMVGFEECRQHYRHPDKIVVTGTPVRGDFFELTRAEARQKLGLTDDRPLVASFWGSLGARDMNAKMVDFFAREQKEGEPFHHIHAVGSNGWETMKQALSARGLDKCPSLDVREYIYDMAVVMRAADLVICRAGASTVSEITALAVPAIIVPSPYVTNNHQEKNARILEKHGGARILLEQECSGNDLYEAAREILSDPALRAGMSRGMSELGILDATERIYGTVMALIQ
ncbi:MAG: undecaprenyldiphospho-muramoylpentapeptide beta-N-acetylglucosaminyltransferase [Oscillospiraceae bacterium]|nr:undecaprenyldiphospho-muramoylpentapeptide beta-N-acetylglucosaminyltransferase [Oscillospiraceae bacterium]